MVWKKPVLSFLSILLLISTSLAQFTIKNSSDVVVMRVYSSGMMGINIGDSTPAATLDVGGNLRIGTVVDEGNSGDMGY